MSRENESNIYLPSMIQMSNASGEDIDPWAIMRQGTPASDGRIPATKPDADSIPAALCAVNGPTRIPAGCEAFDAFAAATPNLHIKYIGTAPTNGDEVGTVAGQWCVETGRAGFKAIGSDASLGVARCGPFSGGTGILSDIYMVGYDYSISGYYYAINGVCRVDIPNFPDSTRWSFTVDDICIVGPNGSATAPATGNSYYANIGSGGFALSAEYGCVNARAGATLAVTAGGGSLSEAMDSGFSTSELNAAYDSSGIPRIEDGDIITIDYLEAHGFVRGDDGTLSLWLTHIPVGSGFVSLQIEKA